MAINRQRGYALLIAVIFMSVLLALGLTLTSLGSKQAVLASISAESTAAFYAADAAMECALSVDQLYYAPGTDGYLQNPFSFDTHLDPTPKDFFCGQVASISGTLALPTPLCYDNLLQGCAQQYVTFIRIPIAFADPNDPVNTPETRCADVTVIKTQNNPAGGSHIYVQGYNVACNKISTSAHVTARGLQANY